MNTNGADESKEPNQSLAPQSLRASWNFSLDQIRASTAPYPEPARDALIAAFRWCIDPRHPMAKAEFARRVGYSDNTLYKLYTGKYIEPDTGKQMPPPADLLKNIAEFLRLEKERYEAGETEFIVTPTARKVFTACELARESRTMVILWGPSHIGKTWALRHHASSNNHGRTFLTELEAASGLGGMVRAIADSCGISDRSGTAKLTERIKRALSPNTLLILDEVHLLRHTYRLNSFFACLEVLRRIHDFTQCGMVLSWTHLDNLKASSEGELVQVWRRGVHKVALPLMPTRADLTPILKHSGLDFPDKELAVTVQKLTEKPYEVLRQVAKRDGLKAITERLRYARKLANRSGDKLIWEHFIDAHLRIEKQAQQEGEWF